MRTLLVGLALAACLLAADISGTWQGKVETDMGSGSPVFVLKQNGEKLTGTYAGALGEAPLSGTVKGQDVVLEIEVQGAKIVYTGKLDADGKTMKGKVDLAGMASGTFTAQKQP